MFFTESLAERLNRDCELTVKVAEHNEIIQAGKVYLAPGGSHMTLASLPNREVRLCIKEARNDSLTPSIDVVMESVAKVYHANAVGVILSGMGQDGCQGMIAIKEAGGKTFVQDESSLIFGMPKAVINAGFADEVLPASEIASAMIECVSYEV